MNPLGCTLQVYKNCLVALLDIHVLYKTISHPPAQQFCTNYKHTYFLQEYLAYIWAFARNIFNKYVQHDIWSAQHLNILWSATLDPREIFHQIYARKTRDLRDILSA